MTRYTTTKKDFWTEGYEAPCRSNGYQSNRPSAFEIDLHQARRRMTVLNNWWLNTKRKMDTRTIAAWKLTGSLANYAGMKAILPTAISLSLLTTNRKIIL